MKSLAIIIACVALIAFGSVVAQSTKPADSEAVKKTMNNSSENFSKVIFAGGCFWCMEKPFEKRDGVISVVSGYAGGSTENPTYSNYMKGNHIEVVEVTYDPMIIGYKELLDVYWKQVDPTDAGGQFVDRGHGYTTAIFVKNDEQKKVAEDSKAALAKSGVFHKKIVTPILETVTFYPAEEYHQDYYKKNPIRYKYYRSRSGRDQFLTKVWGSEKN